MSRYPFLTRWAAFGSLLVALLLPLAGCKKSARDRSTASRESASGIEVKPNRDLLPEDVVRIQIQALSSAPKGSSGLRTAFGFSSPQHRILTGSLSDFERLMDAPEYRPLRKSVEVDYCEPEVDGDRATQIVALTDERGETSFYLFVLSRQSHGDFQGCWMTDAVQTSMYKHQSDLTSSASTYPSPS